MSRARSLIIGLATLMAGAIASSGQTVTQVVNFERAGGPWTVGEASRLSASLWTEKEGGYRVWTEELPDVLIESGNVSLALELGRINPLPSDAEVLWLELEADGQPLGPRTRSHENNEVVIDGRLAVTTGISFNLSPSVYATLDYFSFGSHLGLKNFGGGDIGLWTSLTPGGATGLSLPSSRAAGFDSSEARMRSPPPVAAT